MSDSGHGNISAIKIPDYELIRVIGRGSYGEVWLGRSVLGELRAVKIVRRDKFERDRPAERELEGIQKFEPISRTQKNLVHVLHVGRIPEGFYYVMELADDAGGSFQFSVSSAQLEGVAFATLAPPKAESLKLETYVPRTLRTELRQHGRLPVSECVKLALKLTEALGCLHDNGLVHRDIKPSNIIFVGGEPKLADIGLVASTDASLSCVGTEGYLPPEGPGKPPADLFALGKVIYELGTGRDRTEFPELPTALVDDPRRQELEELNEVILKACDPDVRQRYATAEEMRADLEVLHAGNSLQQVRRRQRRRASLGKAAMAGVLVGIVVWLSAPWREKPREIGRQLPVTLAVNGAEYWRIPFMARQFDFSPDGERIVFAGTNKVSIWERTTGITRRLKLTGATNWLVAGVDGAISMPRWAPDGRQFVFQGVRKIGGTVSDPVLIWAILLVNAETGETRQVGPNLSKDELARDLCWRPQGDLLTYIADSGKIVSLALSGERTLWHDSGIAGSRVGLGGYSPDGGWLAVSTKDRNQSPFDGREIRLVPHLGGKSEILYEQAGTGCPTWGPDGESVYFVSSSGKRDNPTWGIWKLGINRKTMLPIGPAIKMFEKEGAQILYPKFIADGNTLAYAVTEPETDIWVGGSDAMDNGTIAVHGQDPVLSPDGQTIFFVGEKPYQQGVFAISVLGGAGTLRKVTDLKPLGSGFTSSGLSLAPDGQVISLFANDGNQTGVFLVPSSAGAPRLVESLKPGKITVPTWSPDGNWLAYSMEKELIRRSRDGRVREILAVLPQWHGHTLRWSPDGNYVAAFANDSPDQTNESTSVYVVSLADRSVRKLTPDAEAPNEKEGIEWHPSGEFLTYMFYGPGKYDSQIRRAWPDGRPTELMISQTNHWDYLGVWAPDGRRYFFSSTQARQKSTIHVYDNVTKEISHDVWRGGVETLPRWSRDGRTAVWAIPKTRRYFEVIEGFSKMR